MTMTANDVDEATHAVPFTLGISGFCNSVSRGDEKRAVTQLDKVLLKEMMLIVKHPNERRGWSEHGSFSVRLHYHDGFMSGACVGHHSATWVNNAEEEACK